MVKGLWSAARRPRILFGLGAVVLGCGVGFAGIASGAAPRPVGDPNQQAAVQQLQQATVVAHKYVKPIAITASGKGACYPEVRERYSLKLHGVTLAWSEVDQEGWCGNGKRITWQGGATYPKWHALPYCWSDSTTNDSWLQYPAWRHAQNSKQVGIPTPVGCIGLRSLHAHLRYAANGYWDTSY